MKVIWVIIGTFIILFLLFGFKDYIFLPYRNNDFSDRPQDNESSVNKDITLNSWENQLDLLIEKNNKNCPQKLLENLTLDSVVKDNEFVIYYYTVEADNKKWLYFKDSKTKLKMKEDMKEFILYSALQNKEDDSLLLYVTSQLGIICRYHNNYFSNEWFDVVISSQEVKELNDERMKLIMANN